MKFFLFVLSLASLLILFEYHEPALATETDALLNILIRKGVITEQEAEEIKKEAQEEQRQSRQELIKEIKDKQLAVPRALKGLKFGMLAYIDYSYGEKPENNHAESDYNRFKLTRGYLTVKKEILPWFHSRVTLDTHQESSGDWKMRLKYLFGELRPPDFGPLTGMKAEVGLGHIPWLDFEEHVNPFRCQGTMAIERAGTFNSADLGLSLRGDFGGKLADAYEKTGNHHYDGRFGTWHVGVYNGSGYHSSEENKNKVIEGRLTLRPLPEVIPGLQFSYFGLHGKGNDNSNPSGQWPDYDVNLGMLSYQSPWIILTGQYFTTEGNAKGTWIDAQGHALDTKAYSVFGNVKLPVLDKKLSLFGRYDHFDQDDDGAIGTNADYGMYMGGIAYDIFKGNLIMLTYETTDYGRDAGTKGNVPVQNTRLGDDWRVQTVLQLKY